MPTRCGIDSVEIARIARMLDESPSEDLAKIFSPQELADSGNGRGRAASLVVGIPTGVKLFNWLATVYGGRWRMAAPMLAPVNSL